MTYGRTETLETEGFSHILDITKMVEKAISDSSMRSGIAAVTALGSTASVTTMEYEPALVEDMRELLAELIPETRRSRHSETWGDDNGFSHMRASLMGPGVSLPFQDGRLLTGTWQQVVLIDHDNRPRRRAVHVQLVGE